MRRWVTQQLNISRLATLDLPPAVYAIQWKFYRFPCYLCMLLVDRDSDAARVVISFPLLVYMGRV